MRSRQKTSSSASRETKELHKKLSVSEHAAQADRQELADLRSLVFNRQEDASEDPTGKVEFPYTAKSRIVVFGGHDSWSKEIKPRLPNVRFIDHNMLPNAQLIRQADTIWIQTNALSHAFFYHDNNEKIVNTSNLEDTLLGYGWENNIHCPMTYRFYEDGTVHAYYTEDGSLWQTYRYELSGSTLRFLGESESFTELVLVYPTDNITWDLGLSSQIQEIPASQAFFYEVGFVETDSPENALYLVPTTTISDDAR